MNTYDVKELLSERLQKTAWMRQNANSDHLARGAQLEPLLQQIQQVISQRVQLLAQKAEINASESKKKDWQGDSDRLLNLYLHLNTQNPIDPKGLLFKFCTKVCLSFTCIRAWELIGQVVFLAERIPGKLAAGIDAHPEKVNKSSLFIEEKLCEEFEKIAAQLALTYPEAASFTSKEDRQELCMEISKEVAKMLLTPEANLNFGLIASIEKYFFPLVPIIAAQRPPLKCLNISLENHLNKVEIPGENATNCDAIICADLNLHPGTKLTKLHRKQGVLGALLNLPNFGSLNPYLKVAQAIDVEDQFFQNTCQDFIELLSKGYLTRDICDKKECFFFESVVSDANFEEKFDLLKDGCISECKRRSHRLLQAYESALFAVGQAEPDDLIRSKIQHVVMRALSKTFLSQKKLFKSLYHVGLVGQIQTIYKKTLNDSICLIYHPLLSYHSSLDEEVFLPGFNLHHRDPNHLTQKGARIATAAQMMGWLCKVVDRLKANAKQIAASEEDQEALDSVIVALYERVREEQFLIKIIKSYDKNNIAQLDLNASYRNFKRTPMTTLQCEKPWGVSALELNQNFIPHYLAIRPNQPRELLQWVLDYAKWNNKFKPPIQSVFSNPNEIIVFQKGMLGSWYKSGLTSAQWIEKRMVIPGREVLQETMTEEEILCFSQGAKQWLTNDLSLETKKEVDLLFETYCSKKYSIQSFAQQSFFAFESIHDLGLKQKKELPLIWDTILLQSLSQKNLLKLKGSCIPFVKYRENINSKKQYLCCFLNPRTEEVELASINKETTQIVPLGKWDGIKG